MFIQHAIHRHISTQNKMKANSSRRHVFVDSLESKSPDIPILKTKLNTYVKRNPNQDILIESHPLRPDFRREHLCQQHPYEAIFACSWSHICVRGRIYNDGQAEMSVDQQLRLLPVGTVECSFLVMSIVSECDVLLTTSTNLLE